MAFGGLRFLGKLKDKVAQRRDEDLDLFDEEVDFQQQNKQRASVRFSLDIRSRIPSEDDEAKADDTLGGDSTPSLSTEDADFSSEASEHPDLTEDISRTQDDEELDETPTRKSTVNASVNLQRSARSKDLYILVRKARRGEWDVVEDFLLRKLKPKDKRINAADPKNGETTLMLACKRHRFITAQRLCLLGAQMNLRAKDRRTALHYATASGNAHLVRLLLSFKADPNLFGGADGQLPLHIAASKKTSGLSAAQMLLEASLKGALLQKDVLGNLPITYAVTCGNLTLIRAMLQNYPQEQLRWQSEQREGDFLVHIAARQQNDEAMAVLGYDGGADVNVQNRDGQTPLHIATKLGDIKTVKLLYSLRANPDIVDRKDRSPIHHASECGHTEIVDFLIERYKAELHMRTKDGSTLMHLAAEHGNSATVLLFIDLGLPVNMPNKAGNLCLHVAALNGHLECVRTLVEKGSTIDARTRDGYTALHLAVIQNQPEIIQMLLGYGAKVDLKGGPLKETALHIASKMPNGYQCAEMLINSGANVNNATEETGETPLHIAVRAGAVDLCQMFLEEGADLLKVSRSGETVFHLAVRHCHYPVLQKLVNYANSEIKGKDAGHLINMPNLEGETTFHLAAELGKSQSHYPFEEIDIIRLLLQNRADTTNATTLLTRETSLHYCARSGNPDIFYEIVRHLGKGNRFQMACNRQDSIGWSPLMTACEQGHAAVAEILLANVARTDVFDEFGKAALHLAAENGHVDCCEMLLKYKAFVNAKSKLGWTPLHFAAQNGWHEVVKTLVTKYNAVVNAMTLDTTTPLHLSAAFGRRECCQVLLRLGADPNAVDSKGLSPLHIAAQNDHDDVVKIYIKYMPHLVTSPSKSGMTCAHIAAKHGSASVIKELMAYKRAFVTANKNRSDDSLPIHFAVSGGHKEVVRQLISAGTAATAENSEGMTAIHLAAKQGNIEVLQSIPSRVSLQALSRKNGLAAIHIAAFYGNAEVVRELQARVDINSKTQLAQMLNVVQDSELKSLLTMDYGLTPLHMASFMGRENVVRLILNNSSVQSDIRSALLERLAIFYAAMNGHVITVSLLLSRSSRDLRAKDKHRRQPLHVAAENGHKDMVAMLLAQGADVDCHDESGFTPLHYATKNGFMEVMRLLIESGASTNERTTDGKTPLKLSAQGLHVDVLHYLLKKPHGSDFVMEDRTFLMDLMLCGKTNDNESVEAFILNSEAPLFTASILSRSYLAMASKERERAKDLNELSRHCERMTAKLLGLASEMVSASILLKSTDSKGNQFLDALIEDNMKEVIEHASVQRYLSEIWKGSLAKWSSAWLFLLFLGFMLCPPLLIYFVWPMQSHSYHHVPVVKFIAMITSHCYLIGLQTIIAAIPLDPIVFRTDYLPNWYEYIYLAWIGGLLVTELTKPGGSTGLGRIRLAIILCSLLAVLFQIGAIVVDMDDLGRPIALTLMYLRNLMISFAILLAFLLVLDFFQIHHLFGPFGIIISSLMRDLLIFIIVLMLFLVGFTFQICCLFSPIKKDTPDDVESADQVPVKPIALTEIANSSYFATFLTTSVSPLLLAFKSYAGTVRPKKRAARATKRQSEKPVKGEKPKCRPRKSASASRKKRAAAEEKKYRIDGRLVAADDPPMELTNSDISTLFELFGYLYFTIFAMGGLDTLPRAKNAPIWSETLFLIYFGVWLLVASIVLLNLLIAVLTETYKKIHMQSDLEWKFGRAKLIRDMMKMPSAPTPLNLFVRPYLYMKSVHRHGRAMFSAYAQFYADRDEHEGAEELDQPDSKKKSKTGCFARLKFLMARIKPRKKKHLPPQINLTKVSEDGDGSSLQSVSSASEEVLAPSIGPTLAKNFRSWSSGLPPDLPLVDVATRRLSQQQQRAGPQLMSGVLDWSQVVSRYLAEYSGEQPPATTAKAETEAEQQQQQLLQFSTSTSTIL